MKSAYKMSYPHFFGGGCEFAQCLHSPNEDLLLYKKSSMVGLEALFITFSPNLALLSMKSASKTTHRTLFVQEQIFDWGPVGKNIS